MSDEEIIRNFLNGQSPAHDLVIQWVRDVVETRLWVEGISRDDIVSDALLKLLLSLRANKFGYESSLKTYVQRITRFTIIDAIRSRRRSQQYLQEATHDLPDGKTPLELLEENEEGVIFVKIFSLIDDRCKQIWHLMFKEQLSYNQIAQRLHMSEGAVKTKVFRCKEEAIRIRNRIS